MKDEMDEDLKEVAIQLMIHIPLFLSSLQDKLPMHFSKQDKS